MAVRVRDDRGLKHGELEATSRQYNNQLLTKEAVVTSNTQTIPVKSAVHGYSIKISRMKNLTEFIQTLTESESFCESRYCQTQQQTPSLKHPEYFQSRFLPLKRQLFRHIEAVSEAFSTPASIPLNRNTPYIAAMAHGQQFFLRWDNYSTHISYAFGTLRNQEDLVDVTLSCEGKKIRAHKVLLSACSAYFRDVFKDNPCQHPVIVFKNVKYDDLHAIIEFMYQGEVSVAQDCLPSFLTTAELLSVQGLTDGGSNTSGLGSSPSAASTIIDTMTIPKTMTLKSATLAVPQHQVGTTQQTVTLVPKRPTATIKTHPVAVYNAKPQQATKRFVATTAAPTKLNTSTPNAVVTTVSDQMQMDGGNAILNSSASSVSSSVGSPQVKRKRILFDNEENISIEEVNFVNKQMDMDIPDYIEIQTSSGTDDEKGLSAEDLVTEVVSGEQEDVIIEGTLSGVAYCDRFSNCVL